MTFPRRGEVYLVELDPARGREIQKTRPAVVIQNDLGNRNTSITIVAAITSKPSRTPFSIEVKVEPAKGNGLVLSSAILLTQIRTVDRERLVRRLGRLDASTMTKVDEALKVSLGLVDL